MFFYCSERVGEGVILSVVNNQSCTSANFYQRHDFLGRSNGSWTHFDLIAYLYLSSNLCTSKYLVWFQYLFYILPILMINRKLDFGRLSIRLFDSQHPLMPLLILPIFKLVDGQSIVKLMC